MSKEVAKDQYGRPVKNRFTVEWMEKGKWVRSAGTYPSEQAAEEHAKIIGAATGKYRIVPAKGILFGD